MVCDLPGQEGTSWEIQAAVKCLLMCKRQPKLIQKNFGRTKLICESVHSQKMPGNRQSNQPLFGEECIKTEMITKKVAIRAASKQVQVFTVR